MKESLWKGRSGGIDRSSEFESKESVRLRKKLQIDQLPPINGHNDEHVRFKNVDKYLF